MRHSPSTRQSPRTVFSRDHVCGVVISTDHALVDSTAGIAAVLQSMNLNNKSPTSGGVPFFAIAVCAMSSKHLLAFALLLERDLLR